MRRMDLVKVSNGTRVVVKNNVSDQYFTEIMKKARNRFGLKSKDNPNGFIWKNAHKEEFEARGDIWRLEFAGDIDMDFLKH